MSSTSSTYARVGHEERTGIVVVVVFFIKYADKKKNSCNQSKRRNTKTRPWSASEKLGMKRVRNVIFQFVLFVILSSARFQQGWKKINFGNMHNWMSDIRCEELLCAGVHLAFELFHYYC